MDIVKAEILWTRICPLKCSYCSMATGENNSVTTKEWFTIIDALKAHGCGFCAFYGAEPLEDFYKLPDIVGYAEAKGIPCTVITSGISKNVIEKVNTLVLNGCKSLTVSHDIDNLCASSKEKNLKGLPVLKHFINICPDKRDAAVVVTVTRTNYHKLPDLIKTMTEQGIWVLFDFIHPDRGNPGTKTKNYPGIDHLLFTKKDMPRLIQTLTIIENLKDEGYLVHSSRYFLSKVRDSKGDLVLKYNWNCAKEKNFPAWVTIDCDGKIYPCDDFQIRNTVFYASDLIYPDTWHIFTQVWKYHVLKKCKGCCWNTHIDAHAIKAGLVPIKDYTHGGTP